MSLPSLPVSRVVAVSVALTPAGAQAQSLSNLLVLGSSNVIDTTERYRSYTQLSDVATDFGLVAPEYLAAQAWFGQSPQPTSLYVGRWAATAAQGGLRGATLSASQQAMTVWNAITTGSFKILKDGGAGVDVTGLNFSAAANLNAVAGIIQGAANMTGITCVWNAFYQRFEFQSATTGATSQIGFLAAPGSGTDIGLQLGCKVGGGGYVYVGQALESAVACVALMDSMMGQQWYAVVVPTAVNADHLAIAGYIEGTNTKHIYGVTTADAGTLNTATTTDIGYQLQQLKYRRTATQFSSANGYAIVSAFGRILTTNFRGNATVMTLKFKQEPGVIAESLNSSQVAAAEAKNVNLFVNYNNSTAILEQGVMADGTFVDIVTGTDWLAVTIQQQVYNLLYTSVTKIPQTDQGQQLLNTAVEAVCSQGVTNGLLAPGVWNSNGFGTLNQGDPLPKGFYVYSAPVASQFQSDRAARLAMPIQVAAKLAGAIHSANVAIVVNQ